MARHTGGQRFRLDLEALPDHDAPAVVRLRRLLKALLRGYGFRCRSVGELPADRQNGGAKAAGGAPAAGQAADGPATS